MKHVYLGLAILGAVLPYLFFVPFFAAHGLDLRGFVGALFTNGASAGFTADLLVSSAVFWTYLFSRREGPAAWPFVVLNLTIGLSCALPAYLWAVEKAALPDERAV
ncbi:MAG: DUF2834 domain-containing protein [Pseudomonadales bacterium]|jgi:hypothetical protein